MFKNEKYFTWSLIGMTILTAYSWGGDILPELPGETYLSYISNIYALLFMINVAVLSKKLYWAPEYRCATLFLIWALIGFFRGALFETQGNYHIWKNLVEAIFACALPLYVYVFSSPYITQRFYYKWIKIIIPLWFILFSWSTGKGSLHFVLGPIFLYAIFFFYLPKTWKIIFAIILLLMLTWDFGARAQIIKAVITILAALTYKWRQYISTKELKLASLTLFILPIVLLFLGITGIYNVFEKGSENNRDKYIKAVVKRDGSVVEENFAADTRTFIYKEVITSAVKHNYILWGRTLARGNDSVSFGMYFAEVLKTKLYERHRNELCFPNIFTWLGLIGMLLYIGIYIQATWLALYRSNSFAIKLLGTIVAFHFMFGWIEDINDFNPFNMGLWTIIALCLSRKFRSMTNYQLVKWVRACLPSQFK